MSGKRFLRLFLAAALAFALLPATALADPLSVCKIDIREFSSLAQALSEARDADTIELLSDIVYADPIEIENKSFIIRAGAHKLTIGSKGNTGDILTLRNATLWLDSDTGGSITINGKVSATNNSGRAIGIASTGTVIVNGDVTAVSDDAIGVEAGAGGTVTVNGDVTAGSIGAQAVGGTITIGGNVTVLNGSSCIGALSVRGSVVEIDGTLTAPDEQYVCLYLGDMSTPILTPRSEGRPGGGYALAYRYSGDDADLANAYGSVYIGKRSSSSGGGSCPPSYPNRTLTDSAGFTMTGAIAADASLTVQDSILHAAGSCAACDAIRAHGGKLLLIKDISLTGGFNPPLMLTIELGTQYNGQTLTILHCKNGTLETFTATVESGKAIFTVNSLSPFAVFTGTGLTAAGLPKTGSAASLGGALAVAVGLACGGFALRRKK